MPNKSPLYLVHGSLGSGKTTFITGLLKQPEFKNSYIIENEFANQNIDERTLSSHLKMR